LKAFFIYSPTFYTYVNIILFVWCLFRAKQTCVLLEENTYSSVDMLTLIYYNILKKFKPSPTILPFFSWDNLNRIPTNQLKRSLKPLAGRCSRSLSDGLICGNVEAAFIARDQKIIHIFVILPYVGVTEKSNSPRKVLVIDQLLLDT
jgi:hypothetical protein